MFGNKDGAQNSQNTTQESVSSIAPAPDPSTIQAPVPVNLPEAERIQREIIEYFVARLNADLPTTLHPKDNSAKRSQFLQALRENRISSAEEDAFLKTLPEPLSEIGSRQVYDKIVFNLHQKQILAIITGHNRENWQDVLAKDLEDFLAAPRRGKADYRTPVGFADLRRRFLVDIRDKATDAQIDDYIKAMNGIEQNMYGKRYDYYRQFEILRKDAQSLAKNIDAVAATTPEFDTVAPDFTDPIPDLNEKSTFITSLTTIGEERREQLLSHAIVEGDIWRQNGQDYRLGIPSLVNAGLIPYFEVMVENQAVYLTNLFQLTSEQMAAIAYIPSPNGVKVRSFYRDKNIGVWRYLPDYIRDISGEGIDVFGEGFDQKSVTLPILLQAALNQIERDRNILDLSATNPDFLFAGTAPAYATRQEYRDAYSRGLLRGDFYHEVSTIAYNSDSGAIIAPGRRKSAPPLLSVNANVAPNFQDLITRYSVYTAFAGQVMGEGFHSADNQTSWLFYSDYRGRCWVANMETTAPLTSTGCRREWLLTTDIATPLYEQLRLADGYGDPSDTRPGNYISMWNNYLSKVPLIQQYAELVSQAQKSETQSEANNELNAPFAG